MIPTNCAARHCGYHRDHEGDTWDITITVTDKGGETAAGGDDHPHGLIITRADVEEGANVYSNGVALLPEDLTFNPADAATDPDDQIEPEGLLVGTLGHHLSEADFTTATADFVIVAGNLYFTGTTGDLSGASHTSW